MEIRRNENGSRPASSEAITHKTDISLKSEHVPVFVRYGIKAISCGRRQVINRWAVPNQTDIKIARKIDGIALNADCVIRKVRTPKLTVESASASYVLYR
jgi:hypothetical protein